MHLHDKKGNHLVGDCDHCNGAKEERAAIIKFLRQYADGLHFAGVAHDEKVIRLVAKRIGERDKP